MSLPRNFVLANFWPVVNSFLDKGKSAIPPLFNRTEVLSSASEKAKLFENFFCKNSNLDDSDISLPAFPSRNNLKLHNSHVTPKLVKVIINLDFSKTSGPDCISLVVLKKRKPEPSYKLTELFNMCMKESCFPGCCKSHLWSLYLRMLGEVYSKKLTSCYSSFSG